jgi:hypothetical protein
MNQEQAYKVLVDAINLATTKGVFNLQDVSTILTAIQVLQPQETLNTQENDN